MVVGPGITAGQRIDAPIYLQDVVPTTLEWAGAAVPEDVEFQSLVPLLRGETGNWRKAAYGAYIDFQRMVMRDGFKLIGYPKLDKILLFDLRNDPLETRDLSNDPRYAFQLSQLKGELRRLAAELDDPLFKEARP